MDYAVHRDLASSSANRRGYAPAACARKEGAGMLTLFPIEQPVFAKEASYCVVRCNPTSDRVSTSFGRGCSALLFHASRVWCG